MGNKNPELSPGFTPRPVAAQRGVFVVSSAVSRPATLRCPSGQGLGLLRTAESAGTAPAWCGVRCVRGNSPGAVPPCPREWPWRGVVPGVTPGTASAWRGAAVPPGTTPARCSLGAPRAMPVLPAASEGWPRGELAGPLRPDVFLLGKCCFSPLI